MSRESRLIKLGWVANKDDNLTYNIMNDKEIKLIAVLELLGTDKLLDKVADKYKILPKTLENWKEIL